MSKKDDLDNVANQFISSASNLTNEPDNTDDEPIRKTKELEQMAKELGIDSDLAVKLRAYYSNKGYELKAKETRSEKLHLQVTKTLLAALKKAANKRHISVNALVNEVLEDKFIFEEE